MLSSVPCSVEAGPCNTISDGGAAGAPPRRGPPGAWRVADDAPGWYQRRLS